MAPAAGIECPKCGSNLVDVIGGEVHSKPTSHLYITKNICTEEGKKSITLCRYCGYSKRDIEAIEAQRDA